MNNLFINCYLKEFVNSRKNLINKMIGIRPKNVLGHGKFGIVYDTNFKNIALKLTQHKNEAKVLSKIIELKNKDILKGIINIDRIIHFRAEIKNISKHEHNFDYIDLFFVIRELLKPIKNKNILNYDMPKLSSWYYPEININTYLKEIKKIKNTFPDIYKTLRILMKYEIYIWDINIYNMGINNKGTIVLHDITGIDPIPKPKNKIPSIGMIL